MYLMTELWKWRYKSYAQLKWRIGKIHNQRSLEEFMTVAEFLINNGDTENFITTPYVKDLLVQARKKYAPRYGDPITYVLVPTQTGMYDATQVVLTKKPRKAKIVKKPRTIRM